MAVVTFNGSSMRVAISRVCTQGGCTVTASVVPGGG
jgi:hypothetical protein